MGAELQMTFPAAAASPKRRSLSGLADTALQAAVRFWFVVTVIGQVFFAGAVAMFYGLTAARGDLPAWNKSMTHGYIRAMEWATRPSPYIWSRPSSSS